MINETSSKTMDIPILYVFVRTDMNSMTPGKAQAHSGHAANAFVYKNHIKPSKPIHPDVSEWMSQTDQGFGTQINLKAPWDEVIRLVARINEEGAGVGEIVVDPTYPYVVDAEIMPLINEKVHTVEPIDLGNSKFACHRDEATAAYVFGRKLNLQPYLGEYPLHP